MCGSSASASCSVRCVLCRENSGFGLTEPAKKDKGYKRVFFYDKFIARFRLEPREELRPMKSA